MNLDRYTWPESLTMPVTCSLILKQHHMFFDSLFFTIYTPVTASSNNDWISVGDTCNIPVAECGTVKFQMQSPNSLKTVTLGNVLHIPKIVANLVSFVTLQCQGTTYKSYTEGSEVGLVMLKDGVESFCASLSGSTGTLYHIPCISIQSESAYVASGSLHLWHCCLGHLNHDAIRDMQWKNMVKGLTITTPITYNHVCKGCTLGKSHQTSLSEHHHLQKDGPCYSQSHWSNVY